MERYLLCLRHYYTKPQSQRDQDEIYQTVVKLGGHVEIAAAYVDYYVREDLVTFLLIKHPDLVRMPVLDYLV
jgi:hypothetical protein